MSMCWIAISAPSVGRRLIWINEDTVVLSQQGSAGNWQLLCFLVLIAYWPDGIQFLLPYLFHLIRHLLLVTTCILKRNIASFSRR